MLLKKFNNRLYDKNSESFYFFFLHQNQNIFFSNIGNQNFLLEKNHNPPFKLNGRSLTDGRLGLLCCRPSVSTICGRIMIGMSLSSISKHNMWSYYDWVVVVVVRPPLSS
jgi:hypothetical protein